MGGKKKNQPKNQESTDPNNGTPATQEGKSKIIGGIEVFK